MMSKSASLGPIRFAFSRRVGAGVFMGFFLAHPASMLIVSLASPGASAGVSTMAALDWRHLPMGMLFAFVGALGGYVYHRAVERNLAAAREAERMRLQRERLEVLLQTAGAVCHELGQPMTVVRAHAEVLLDDPPPHPMREDLHAIIENVDEMVELLRKLQNVTRYATKPYVGNVRIIDLDEATRL